MYTIQIVKLSCNYCCQFGYTLIYQLFLYTEKPELDGIARDQHFVAAKTGIRLIEVGFVRICMYSREQNSVQFRIAQDPFKAGFTVFTYIALLFIDFYIWMRILKYEFCHQGGF